MYGSLCSIRAIELALRTFFSNCPGDRAFQTFTSKPNPFQSIPSPDRPDHLLGPFYGIARPLQSSIKHFRALVCASGLEYIPSHVRQRRGKEHFTPQPRFSPSNSCQHLVYERSNMCLDHRTSYQEHLNTSKTSPIGLTS